MKLKTTADCKLILEGVPEKGLEVLLLNYNKAIVIDRKDDLKPDVHTHIMDKDGLYQYYVLDFGEKEEPSDLVEYINKYKEDPEIGKDPLETFSICKLRNCLIQKEKDAINSFLKNCNTKIYCNTNNETLNDFLLISIFLLENLICRGNYEEAIRILESITTCGICSEFSLNKNRNCCG